MTTKRGGPLMLKLLRALLGRSKKSQRDNEDLPQESQWIRWKPNVQPPAAPSGFVKLTGATDVAVAGTSYRLDECKVAISALKGGRVNANTVSLIRETDNPEHENAVRVVINLRHRQCHIGYLPRDVADRIAQEFAREMPLEATLREWGQKKSGDALYFKLSLFAPNAKDRKKFSRKAE